MRTAVEATRERHPRGYYAPTRSLARRAAWPAEPVHAAAVVSKNPAGVARRVLQRTSLSQAANASVRTAALRNTQRTHGNRIVQRLVGIPGRSPIAIQRNPGEPSRPPAAPSAFKGIEPYYMVEELPYVEFSDTSLIIRAGDYILGPNMLRTDPPSVVYYIAYSRTGRRNEFVVGPDSVDTFIAELEGHTRAANMAYAWVPPGQQIPDYQARSARAVARGVSGDVGGYFSGLGGSWVAAFKDPGWWAQAIVATAGAVAAVPTPRAPVAPPALRVIPGGGGTVAGTVAPRMAAPVLATEGSAALAPAVAQAPAVAAAPAPALTVLPGGGAASAPAVSAAAPAFAGTTAAVSMTSPGTLSVPAPAPATSPAPEPEAEEECRPDPCPTPLPISWPTELPYPGGPDPLIRTPADVREAEGLGDRGAAQRRLREEIVDARARGLPPPRPCDPDVTADPGRWNAPFDAHHKHPLYLGGVDARSNLCALDADLHQAGHPRLDYQLEWLDEYLRCGICSAKLSHHPAYQEYVILGTK